ncbi:hypothetical protein FDI24_gp224 [Acidovorax phage ACP17]|uniref:Uncharacterized protein n=1 Tax=Acidovorax phage ACP17 TaxID=2010329 RepID=A0A218M385_9CAUD|nr:hypothetical protein FDI24_gp224 [Acidovorax phage ACP17]ASD50505.1 hypothetical protein [Acidovorax phage ACP17]
MKAKFYSLPGFLQHAIYHAMDREDFPMAAWSGAAEKVIEAKLTIKVEGDAEEYEIPALDILDRVLNEHADARINRRAREMAQEMLGLEKMSALAERMRCSAAAIDSAVSDLERVSDEGFKDIHPDVYWESSSSQNC